jgi:hypothetical protein
VPPYQGLEGNLVTGGDETMQQLPIAGPCSTGERHGPANVPDDRMQSTQRHWVPSRQATWAFTCSSAIAGCRIHDFL